jgi:hypothetical protein
MNNSRNKKVACTVSAAALMLGVSSAATIGLHFQENYCGSASYSGFPVTLTAFGIAPTSWENLLPMNTGYSSCAGPLGYNLSEVIDTTTSTGGLNPLPNGSISVNWFGPTANYDPFAGYAGTPPNYYHPGGSAAAMALNTTPASGEEEVYATFIRDGINFGPGSGSPKGNNDQPGYTIDITGLKSLFTNSSFVVELMASGDSIETLTNALVIDVPDAITNSVSYPNTPPVVNSEGSSYYQGTGGGLSTGSAPLNTDHIFITSVQPVHVAGQYNHAGTISGFIITDKPLVSMYPQTIPLVGPGDTVLLNPYAIGVPPLSYQWQLNGASIPGATNSSISITNVTLAVGGSYTLVVTNSYGATTSQVSTVTVDRLTQTPTNDIAYDSNPTNLQHDGAVMGATWEASSSDGSIIRTGVMDFVATNADGITVDDAPGFDGPTGTITFWMQSSGTDPNSAGSTGASLFCRTAGISTKEFLLLQADGSPGNLIYLAPGFVNNFTSVAGVSDGKWHFLALTFDQSASGGAAWFIDGALDTTNANSGSWAWPAGNDPLEIGYTSDSTWRDYNGLLDDFRYYSTILTPAQIATIHNSGAIVDTNDLQLQLNFTAPPGQGITLTWQEGTAVLQSAPTVTGPWTDLPGVSSPYIVVPSATQQYFRYRYVPQALVSNPYLM